MVENSVTHSTIEPKITIALTPEELETLWHLMDSINPKDYNHLWGKGSSMRVWRVADLVDEFVRGGAPIFKFDYAARFAHLKHAFLDATQWPKVFGQGDPE